MLRTLVIRVLLLCLLVPAAEAQVRVRKNIDDLSPDELKAFAHAIQKLKDSKDPASNYLFWADIHGIRKDNRGPCEHQGELLWPWHRAYLLAFEDALRASDPPMTSNVTIPYWDWSRPSSGSRYPKAFETMPELMGVTCTGPCRETTPNANPPFDPQTLKDIQDIDNWPGYGGGQKAQRKKGELEFQPHDFIHGDYIGGLNESTKTAARDPLFWAHHAFMDYLWAQWQQAHPGAAYDPVCKTCAINFLPGKTAGDYLDIAILGYRYEPSAPRAAAKRVATAGLTRMLGISVPHASAVEIPMTLPEGKIESVVLNFDGVTIPTDASYLVNIYLVRPGTSAAERHKSQPLTFFAAWRMEGEHAGHDHGDTVDQSIDITKRLLRQLQGHTAAGKWMLEAEIVRSQKGKLEPAQFGKPFGWKNVDVVVKTAK